MAGSQWMLEDSKTKEAIEAIAEEILGLLLVRKTGEKQSQGDDQESFTM
jgi:hypothetical protein